MKRIAGASALVLAAFIVTVASVSAGRAWCRADPIVKLNGATYQAIVSVPEENVHQVNGPLYFAILSPEGSQQELLFVDAGFNGHGERVDFREHDSESKHIFYLKVPKTDDDFPVLLDLYKDGQLINSVSGTTNGVWVSVPADGESFSGDGDHDDSEDGEDGDGDGD